MHIETAIQELTAAIKESTATQRELLAAVLSNAAFAAVPTPAPAAEPKAAKPKKQKPAPAPEPEPTPEPEPEAPAAEPTPEAITIPELRNLIKAKLGEDASNRAKFDALRKEFGVGVISELPEDKICAFHKEVLTW